MPPLVNRDNTCCFTGHRPEKLPWTKEEYPLRAQELENRLFDILQVLYGVGIRHLICGMARGCDMIFLKAAFRLREEHEDVTIEAAIPCEGQAERWTKAERAEYYRFVSECDVETVLQGEMDETCMLRRNRYMVDHSCILIAVYDGSRGGTMHTVHYAEKQDLEILRLEP